MYNKCVEKKTLDYIYVKFVWYNLNVLRRRNVRIC
jgi:hypothetical protein